MRLGASLFLIAAGAILAFAVTDSVRGVNLYVVGVVLMIVGGIGLLAEVIIWTSRRRTDVLVREDRYVDGAPPPPRY
jgi:hypothetical protein